MHPQQLRDHNGGGDVGFSFQFGCRIIFNLIVYANLLLGKLHLSNCVSGRNVWPEFNSERVRSHLTRKLFRVAVANHDRNRAATEYHVPENSIARSESVE